MEKRVSVAVVGATGLVGEPLLAILESRKFPLDTLYCLDDGDAVGEGLRYSGKSLTVQSIADFDFTQVQLVFFCSEVSLAVTYAHLATEAGATVIDCSGAFSAEYDVPLIIPGINPQALEEFSQSRIIAAPCAATVALLLVLKPLHDAVGIERVDLTAFEPVSVAGKAGVDELASQTVALLNMKQARHLIFPQQIAFNVLPQLGSVTDNGYTEGEMTLIRETQKILGEAEIKLNPTLVLVPVFYGNSMAVHLETRGYLSVEEARALLSEASSVTIAEGGAPTPVMDASKGEGVFIGRMREDISRPHGLDLWLTADNLRTGAALNAVQIAEQWEKCYI